MLSHGSGAFRDPKITDKFNIFVKTLSGKTVIVETAKCESVTMLMKSAANKSGIPIDHQVLIFQGKSFERGKMIKDYNTQKDSTVHMTTLLRGGVQGQDFDVPPAMDYHQIVNTLNQWSGVLKQLTAENEKLKNDTGGGRGEQGIRKVFLNGSKELLPKKYTNATASGSFKTWAREYKDWLRMIDKILFKLFVLGEQRLSEEDKVDVDDLKNGDEDFTELDQELHYLITRFLEGEAKLLSINADIGEFGKEHKSGAELWRLLMFN